MNINKAVKRERKVKITFFLLMIILFISIPSIAILVKSKSLFIWSYIGFIELLIILACLVNANYYKLNYLYRYNEIIIKNSLFTRKSLISCDKVKIVHTNKENDELEIIIISTEFFKNKVFRPVNDIVLKKYPEITGIYLKEKKLNPQKVYYFRIIKKGGYRKYQLLDVIYKSCVKAKYTSSAITSIKRARGQIEI